MYSADCSVVKSCGGPWSITGSVRVHFFCSSGIVVSGGGQKSSIVKAKKCPEEDPEEPKRA